MCFRLQVRSSKIFERGVIGEFIPDLWDMLQTAEGEEQETTVMVQSRIVWLKDMTATTN
jgi:hypothetical protein